MSKVDDFLAAADALYARADSLAAGAGLAVDKTLSPAEIERRRKLSKENYLGPKSEDEIEKVLSRGRADA